MIDYHIERDGKRLGPVTLEQLIEYSDQGHLLPTDWVIKGTGEPRMAASIEGLFAPTKEGASFCQKCLINAPTRQVIFHQNIGLLLGRFTKKLDLRICKSCLHKSFWGYTFVNIAFGWWGVISLIVTPFFILNNIGLYILNLGMEPVPSDSKKPELTSEAIERIKPFVDLLFSDLNDGTDIYTAVTTLARRARSVTPGQIMLYVQAMPEHQTDDTSTEWIAAGIAFLALGPMLGLVVYEALIGIPAEGEGRSIALAFGLCLLPGLYMIFLGRRKRARKAAAAAAVASAYD
jgi:hypothetical protein